MECLHCDDCGVSFFLRGGLSARQIQNGKAKQKCKRAGGTPALRNGSCAIRCVAEIFGFAFQMR
jgi:hypothetical protein